MIAHGEIFLTTLDWGIFIEGLETIIGIELEYPII